MRWSAGLASKAAERGERGERMSQPYRLNPLALPPETNGRFRLLVLLALAVTFEAGALLQEIVLPEVTSAEPTSFAPAQPQRSGTANTVAEIDKTADNSRRDFHRSLERQRLPLVMCLLLLGTAYVLYRRHPRSVCRQGGKSTPPPLDAGWERHLNAMSRRVGLARPPLFELASRGGEQGGQAFGTPGAYVVQMGDRMRLVYSRARDRFDALVLHELAHIANGDIGRSYFVQALWSSLVVIVWLPLAVGIVALLFGNVRRHHAAGEAVASVLLTSIPYALLLRFALTYAVVLLVRASVLRAREFYADAKAASVGARETLRTLFTSAGSVGGRVGLRWTRLHPRVQERAAALDNPARLFSEKPSLGFAAGLLQGVIVTGTLIPLLLLASGIVFAGQMRIAQAAHAEQPDVATAQLSLLASDVCLLLIGFAAVVGLGWLLFGSVGLQAVRAELARSDAQRAGLSSGARWLLGIAAGVGFEAGLALSTHGEMWYLGQNPALTAVLGAVAATANAWVSFGLLRWNVRRWLSTYAGNTLPKRRLSWILFTSSLVNGSGTLLVLAVRSTRMLATNEEQHVMVVSFLLGTGVCWVAAVLLAGLPVFRKASTCPQCHSRLPAGKYTLGQPCPKCSGVLGTWLHARDVGADSAATREVGPPPLPVVVPPPLPL